MRKPKRYTNEEKQRLVNKVLYLWTKEPELRFFQFMEVIKNNLFNTDNCFYVEDDMFEEKLDEYIEENKGDK